MRLISGDLALRPFQLSDRDTLVRLADNPRVAQYLAARFPHPYRESDADAWLEIAKTETRICNFAIEWQGAFVGGAGLVPLADIYSGTSEVGYWLGEPYWGKGLMTRAVALLTQYAFDELLFIRLQANVLEGNAGSMRALEKNGYVREGIMRKHARKNGVIFDVALYAKLRNP